MPASGCGGFPASRAESKPARVVAVQEWLRIIGFPCVRRLLADTASHVPFISSLFVALCVHANMLYAFCYFLIKHFVAHARSAADSCDTMLSSVSLKNRARHHLICRHRCRTFHVDGFATPWCCCCLAGRGFWYLGSFRREPGYVRAN